MDIITWYPTSPMFPLIFLKCACAQNFRCATFYQHLTIFRKPCMKYVQTHFKRKIYMRSKFPCVCSSHDLCAHAHSLAFEGTLNITKRLASGTDDDNG